MVELDPDLTMLKTAIRVTIMRNPICHPMEKMKHEKGGRDVMDQA